MFSKTSIVTVFILAISVAYSCSVALLVPTAMDAQRENVELDTLIRGRELYIGSCGSCHSLYLPEKYTRNEWKTNIDKMQKPAKITTGQAQIIYKYLSAKSKQ